MPHEAQKPKGLTTMRPFIPLDSRQTPIRYKRLAGAKH